MKTYRQLKSKLLKDKKIKNAYDALEPEFALINTLIQKRLEKGLTQKEIAEKVGTRQSAISRLESGTYNPSLAFLHKIAEALDTRLQLSLIKKSGSL
ncbi:MAG: transcriptional regulator [Candidatus Jacksonbacteria bacterium RIFOXYC2_FULL_44_29]|nr:MAG: Helix-turn-helix domain protein [Parcubacteria group bacterium GW2011_GWA2_42_28]KKT55889.1 MAG: Helix-turn-helix domain protein [Parcubacteria group bacterium GW2011_GWC2_44_22]OGY74503.1 MAG: transcriptional regulator [Candidatus Jacksonbacteria bacterium RIFOXYA2_FULL_43_12]OGY77412.1 MAG: transcriptional regulator [Candidatus Jacksonbacteria bacterium RIFOXYB2_FULL_44_15]OGY78184.1 MAG: transcriptional regulator [Candidatus Jacksonbacteria bacterium RIFOXYD2_FULL_43_21]OGY80762.1 M